MAGSNAGALAIVSQLQNTRANDARGNSHIQSTHIYAAGNFDITIQYKYNTDENMQTKVNFNKEDPNVLLNVREIYTF